jgi:glycosyltransferase involved in cell wall biosynthesis
MATLLRDDGYRISVVTPKIYKGSHYFENQGGIKVYRFPFFARDKLLIEYKKIPYFRMIFYYLTGFLWTLNGALKNKCKMIHVHWAIPTGLIGIGVGGFLRKPVIVTIHGSDLRLALEKPGFLRKIFVYVCQNAAYVYCVSDVQKRELGRLGIPDKRISTIPMGIDEAFLEKGEQRERVPKEGPATILTNRNLLPIYNVSLLIRAIPMVLQEEPRTKFLVAGDGPERENLERETRDLKVSPSVKFLGRVPHDKMADLLGRIDIFVSTSLHDGTSVSLLEAMGSGAFPIVTDIPSNREWIESGQNGFLVPVNEEKILAEKILEAIRNQNLRKDSRVKNFCLIKEKGLWSVTIEKAKGIYEMVLDSKS